MKLSKFGGAAAFVTFKWESKKKKSKKKNQKNQPITKTTTSIKKPPLFSLLIN